MGADTRIEWAHHTFNPWVGCTRLSPACDHCYAEAYARRTGQAHLWQGKRRRTGSSTWRQPGKWNEAAAAAGERQRVFCASLADVFDNQVPSEWRRDLWRLIEVTSHLDWLLLTKRPQNIRKMVACVPVDGPDWGEGWPHVWLGTTVEDRARLGNIDHLRAVPARIRFLSIEPLLEDLGTIDLTGIHLVIVGGESGPKARPMHPAWVRSIRDQCAAAGVPFFFKQWGEYLPEGQLDAFGFGWAPGEDGRVHWWQAEPPIGEPLPDDACSIRVGKTTAGRQLDGRFHDAMPA